MIEEANQKAVVVINDLRAVPVLAALKVARLLLRTGQPVEVVVSRRLLHCRDFGDYMPTLYKIAVLALLRAFFGVRAIAANPATEVTEVESMGITSSLYSITNDSGADRQSYPQTYEELVSLSKGAKEVIAHVESESVAKIYLFNGRTASSYPLSRFAHARNLTTLYYEYASGYKGFKLYPCPPHASWQLGYALIKFYRQAVISLPVMASEAQTFERLKINNPYAVANNRPLSKEYDVSMFLGSDHEYTAVDPSICGIEWRGNLDFCKRVVAKYGPGKRYAVRCHPNQRSDKNWRVLSAEIVQFCNDAGADFYGPDSGVASHDLIRKSHIVATDLSSIALDAVLLGKEVDVFGATDLQKILQQMHDSLRSTPALCKKIVAEMFGLSERLFYIRFNRVEALLCMVMAKVNAVFMKVYTARASH